MSALDLRRLRDDIERWLDEDIGYGDITTKLTVSDDAEGRASFVAKESGVLCGTEVVFEVFSAVDDQLDCSFVAKDGEQLSPGMVFGSVAGRLATILTAERLALNLLRHLSGVSTATKAYVDALDPKSKTKILDTRKTTPGLRYLEKYAVRTGGGYNHRQGLYDAILIKDNHISAAGGVGEALSKARSSAPHLMRTEIEVENLEQLSEALSAGADTVLLDNMSDEQIEKAIATIDGRAIVEVSGNVSKDRVHLLSKLGVDLISVGAITHSVRALDISLDISYVDRSRSLGRLGL